MSSTMNAVRKHQAFQAWRADADGLIHLRTCSHDIEGGDEGFHRLKLLKIPISESAAFVLEGLLYKPTLDMDTRIVIIPGAVFHDRERATERVVSYGMGQGYSRLCAEPAWLLVEALTESSLEAMGLRQIVVIHKPVPHVFVNTSGLLCLGRGFDEDVFVHAVDAAPNAFWRDDVGFAFADPT